MTTREKFLTARTHIQAKEYDKARTILVTIDHPKAHEWLNRIDQLQPTSSSVDVNPSPKSRSKRGLLVMGTVVIGVLIAGIALFITMSDSPAPLGLESLQSERSYPLTEYFPSDTLIYSAVRTDDEQIMILDNLLIHAQAFLRSPLTTPFLGEEPFSLSQSFDQATILLFQEDFETAVRPWLGDWIAMGMFNLDIAEEQLPNSDNIGILIVVEITDREKVTAFIEKLTAFDPNQTFTRSENGKFTIFKSNEWMGNHILINDDTMMIASDYASSAVQEGITNPLTDVSTFKETMQLLPEDNYGVTVYIRFEPIFKAMFTTMEAFNAELASNLAEIPDSDVPMMTDFSYDEFLPDGVVMDDVMAAVGQMAMGITIVDDYTVMFDGVHNTGNPEVLAKIGMTLPYNESADPSFLRYVPENAGFVMQGTDLKSSLEQALSTQQMQWNILQKNSELASFYEEAQVVYMQAEIDRIDAIIEPETGFTIQEDVMAWMTGNYAIFSNYDPSNKSMLFSYYYPDQSLKQNLDAGILIEVTDSNHVQQLIDSLGSAMPLILNDVELTVSYETIAGRSALILHVPARDLLSIPLDVVVATNDTILVIATREIATQILNGEGGFDSSTGYLSVQERLLPDSESITYFGNDGINLIADAMIGLLPPYFNRMVNDLNTQLGDMQSEDFGEVPPIMNNEQRQSLPLIVPPVRMVLSIFDSMTMSIAVNEDYDTVSRFTLTFAE